MRKIKNFLKKVGEALAPYAEEAEREVETLQASVSEVVPDRVKVFARTWFGAISLYMAGILLCLMSGAFWALLFGRREAIAAMVFVNIIAVVAITSAFLLRWDDEGWQICKVCGKPTSDGNFCDQCGALLRPDRFPWLVEQK